MSRVRYYHKRRLGNRCICLKGICKCEAKKSCRRLSPHLRVYHTKKHGFEVMIEKKKHCFKHDILFDVLEATD